MFTDEFTNELFELLGDCEQVLSVDYATMICTLFGVPLNRQMIEHDFFFDDDFNTLQHGGKETGISALRLSYDLCRHLGIDSPGTKYREKMRQASANQQALVEWFRTREARVLRPEVLPSVSEIDPRLVQVILTITHNLRDAEMASLELAIATGADPRKNRYYEKVSELFHFDGTKMPDQVRAVFKADLEQRFQRRCSTIEQC